MSYTNETTYYGLPLPTGSDKSTFTDNNTAFQAVDAALHTAAEQSGAATSDLVTVKADIVDLKAADVTMSGDIDAAEINIEALQQKELLQDAAIDAVKADAFDMITAYNEPTATSTHAYSAGDFFIYNDVLYRATDSIAIGDTIVPDTNCVTTNVSSEIVGVETDLSKIESISYIGASTVRAAYYDGYNLSVTIPYFEQDSKYFVTPVSGSSNAMAKITSFIVNDSQVLARCSTGEFASDDYVDFNVLVIRPS